MRYSEALLRTTRKRLLIKNFNTSTKDGILSLVDFSGYLLDLHSQRRKKLLCTAHIVISKISQLLLHPFSATQNEVSKFCAVQITALLSVVSIIPAPGRTCCTFDHHTAHRTKWFLYRGRGGSAVTSAMDMSGPSSGVV